MERWSSRAGFPLAAIVLGTGRAPLAVGRALTRRFPGRSRRRRQG